MERKIDIGGVLGGTFDIYRDQAGILLPAALVVFVVAGVVTGVLTAISPILFLVGIAVTLVAQTLYQGMVVELTADVQDGRRDSSVGDLFRAVTGVVLPLIVAGLLAGIGIAIGIFLLIVPGLFLATIWAVIAPVIVLERPGILPAFGRSRHLVKGNGWQVFGVIVIVFLITFAIALVFSAVGAAAGDVGRVIANTVASIVVAPIGALAAAILYFNLREAHGEGARPAEAGEAPAGVPQAGAPREPAAGQETAAGGATERPPEPPPSQQQRPPAPPGGGPQSPQP
jgi:hypothetical protein